MISRSFGAVIAHNDWAVSENPREHAHRDKNISGLCSAQNVSRYFHWNDVKKNAGFIFVISKVTKIAGGRSRFGELKEKECFQN